MMKKHGCYNSMFVYFLKFNHLATYSKEKRFFAIAQNDNLCHPERSEGSF